MKLLDIFFAEIPTVLLRLDSFSLPLQNPVLIFSIILFIILFAPIILNRFKIPHLIGLIIAGAIIGPYGFFLVERNSAFTLFGQVGLLYIMFLAGLEIDLAEFRKNSAKSLVFGLYTFLIPITLGYLSGRYILQFSVPSSILLASIFASHTLIAYPLISKFGVAKNRAVNITIGGTLITDTLALLVLAAVASRYSDGYGENFAWNLAISVLSMGAFVMLVFPIIGRWFFKRYSDSVAQYIFVLGMVFLAAFLAELAGIEAIIGAFLAGLALNRLIPHTSALMNRIEFVGNALFIPFLLIGIGMLINFRVFYEDFDTIKVATVITLVAMFGKYVAAWLAQKSFGYTIDERRLIFGLSNAHVAAALAVVLVGYNIIIDTDEQGNPIRLLNESVLNGSIVLIMVTCTVASFVAQKGARNIALADNTNDVPDETDMDERILVAISQTSLTERLMELSLNVKAKHNKDGLFALNVVTSESPDANDEKRAVNVLNKATEAAAATDHYVHRLKRYDVNYVNGIMGIIREHGITDLIMGIPAKNEDETTDWGDSINELISKCNATTLIYKPAQPLATVKRHLVLVPERAEREIGFPFWLVKIWNMSRNVGGKIVMMASPATITLMKKITRNHPWNMEYRAFADWDDFLILGKEIKKDDLLYVVMSRKHHPSYTPAMNRIPYYLGHYFYENGFVIVYPMQSGIKETDSGDLKNPSFLEPFQDNLERLDDIAKTLTKLFKRK
jgi:Kef-type K+ transport system membrane component KefB